MYEHLRFRDPKLAKRISEKIREVAQNSGLVKICHVCGTHEWTITHYGLRSMLPPNVEVIAGPGCPVCVTPSSEIDEAIKLALRGITVACFGDVLRVPGSEKSLLDAKAEGADVRVVYSVDEAVKMARKEPTKEFVFFAIGFETTAPSTAIEVLKKPPENLSFLVSHRLIPPAMELLLGIGDLHIDGFIAPGHVSTVIGLKAYEIFPKAYRMPTVVAGFEPIDVLFAIYMILKQLKEGAARLENEYVRAVTWEGNLKAQEVMRRAFDTVDGEWRGLGKLPSSAFKLKKEHAKSDAHERFGIRIAHSHDLLPGCQCHLVMIGKIKPVECPLFMKACTTEKPLGACMVSVEGTCRIWAKNIHHIGTAGLT
ncbi:MAG: hydrogenase formation protein HypD [Nitrososphaerota archaeon]|nr:hydrogenase formation protein HypD [Candidatus Bathyarchaeota archaeon]MDW8023919.1 hydrogenase formation protein HypD [Nitrososphaerota archaeon]